MNTDYQNEAESIWDSYLTEATKFIYKGQPVTFRHLFRLTTDLLGETINCYANGLTDATVIMCRSTIDACIFEYLELEIIPGYSDKGNVSPFYIIRRDKIMNKNGRYLKNWKQISEAIKKSDLFGKEEVETKLNEIYEVRDRGNFVAHLFQRSQVEADKATRLLTVMTWLKDNIEIANIRQWGYTDEDISNARKMLEKNECSLTVPYRVFAPIVEAKETLEQTIGIILDTFSRFAKNHGKYLVKK